MISLDIWDWRDVEGGREGGGEGPLSDSIDQQVAWLSQHAGLDRIK